MCRRDCHFFFVVTNLVETVLSNNDVVEANGDDAGVRIPRLGVASCGLLPYFFDNRSATLSVAVVVVVSLPFALFWFNL